MSVYEEKNKCCWCSACVMICPKQCISMQLDDEGFLYPLIDKSLCVNCLLCQKVCPVLKKRDKKNNPNCYIAFSRNKNIRKKSSSGGLFTELAKQQIEKGAYVYGAGFDENFEVIHKGGSSVELLEELRGSKYVQSRMDDKYQEIKEILDKGGSVYFSGAPCQVSGLYSYLRGRPEKLITQDFICHGVPSPLVWKKYLATFGNVKKVEFRNKKYGWHYFALHIESDKKNYYKRLDEDFYLKLFLDNTTLRPICYDCPIKKQGSMADITLADCWSLNHMTDRVTDTDKGLSLVLANTLCGEKCLEELEKRGDVFKTKVDSQKAVSSQLALKKSASYNSKRNLFFDRLKNEEFSTLMNEWFRVSLKEKFRIKYVYIKTKIRFALKVK